MRFLLTIAGLIVLFVLLAQVAPPALQIPLYCIFTVAGMGYAWWERRRLADRRAELERELAAHRPERLNHTEEE